MLKRTLIAIAALALLAVPAMAVPPGPAGTQGNIAQAEIPVTVVIDKFAQVDVAGPILLHEKAGGWWEGLTEVTVYNNWSVVVTATIEEYLPSVIASGGETFQCLIEGSGDAWGAGVGNENTTSSINLHPYPGDPILKTGGYTMRLWAGIQSPDLFMRASSAQAQRVATIYLTVAN